MTLRPYQNAAIAALYAHLGSKDNNPLIVLPTGAGKSPVMAAICRDAVVTFQPPSRVLILAHVKELIVQTAEKINLICPEIMVGIYSAGLGQRDTLAPVIVAGIQSVYDKANEIGRFDLVMVDECFPAGTMIDTPRGKVEIEKIRCGEYVHCATGVGEVVATRARPTSELISLEFSNGTKIRCTRNHKIFTEQGWIEAGKLAVGQSVFSREDVRILWDSIHAVPQHEDREFAGKSMEENKFLLNLLLEEIEKSNAQSGSAGEGESLTSRLRPQTNDSRRKRSRTHDHATRFAGGFGAGVETGVRNSDENQKGERVSDVLQVGFGAPGEANRNRNQRRKPLQSTRSGYEENQAPDRTRLVSVEHLKCDSKITVYNLHVQGHPSYFADGILVHNCHLLKTDGEGRYVSLLNRLKEINPNIRIIGLTATPFRLDSGHIAGPENILNEVCYEASVSDLIAQNYLCPLVSKAAKHEGDFAAVHTRLGEFVAAEVESIVAADPVVDAACNELMNETSQRRSVLVFAQSVAHGEKVTAKLKSLGQRAESVFGDTLDFERDQLIEDFKNGRLKYLVNVGVLTTGFDAPNIDCVAILRPTMSPGLYYQMVGRGFRLHPSKTNCLILDFGGNVERHGPVDLIQPGRSAANRAAEGPPGKMCAGCRAYCNIGYAACPHCGQVFAPREKQERETTHNAQAHGGGVLAGQETITRYEVLNVDYSIHKKLMDDPENPGRKTVDPNKPPTMKVEYEISFNKFKSQWVCFEHRGFALDKAYDWWNRMRADNAGCEVPRTVSDAVEMCRAGMVRIPSHITVKAVAGKPFDEIIEYEFETRKPDDVEGEAHTADAIFSTAGTVHDKRFYAANSDGEVSQEISGADVQAWIDGCDLPVDALLFEAGNDAAGWQPASWWGFRFKLPPRNADGEEPVQVVADLSAHENADEIPF